MRKSVAALSLAVVLIPILAACQKEPQQQPQPYQGYPQQQYPQQYPPQQYPPQQYPPQQYPPQQYPPATQAPPPATQPPPAATAPGGLPLPFPIPSGLPAIPSGLIPGFPPPATT